MKNRILLFFFAFALCFNNAPLIAGGGWPQPKGEGYFKLYEWWIVADQHYTDRGLLDPNVTTGLYNTNLYAEYGFTDRFTGIVHIPLFSRATVNNLVSTSSNEVLTPGDAINSVGDANVIFKYGLTPKKRVSIAPSLTLGLPLGISEGGSQGNLQTGDGEFNQMIMIDAGMGFRDKSKVPIYANAYLGFNNRTNGFSDEIRGGFELGLMFLEKKFISVVRLDVVESLMNGVPSGEMIATSTFANNTEFTSIGIELNYMFRERLGISLGTAGAVSGKVILAAPSYSAGLFFTLK